jgi:antitoxin YefM
MLVKLDGFPARVKRSRAVAPACGRDHPALAAGQDVEPAEGSDGQDGHADDAVCGTLSGTIIEGLAVMSITASEARKALFPLIKKVNEDHDVVEIVSKHGNAVLVSAEDYAALREGAYLLRSPANARRLLKAYENALNGIHIAEHDLVDPDAADAR